MDTVTALPNDYMENKKYLYHDYMAVHILPSFYDHFMCISHTYLHEVVVLGGFLEHHGGGWWKMAAFPLPVTIWDDLISRFRHIGWGHFHGKWPHRKRKMRSSQMVTGSGKAAIFHHPPPWCSKNPPSVLDDVCRTLRLLKNVLQTSASPMTHHDLVTHVFQRYSEIRSDDVWFILLGILEASDR